MLTKHYCYKVCIGDCVMAQYMELDTATTLAKALFEEHLDEESMDVTIKRVRINEIVDPCEAKNDLETGIGC